MSHLAICFKTSAWVGPYRTFLITVYNYSFSPQPGSSVELSSSGYQFLTDLFNKYDRVRTLVVELLIVT